MLEGAEAGGATVAAVLTALSQVLPAMPEYIESTAVGFFAAAVAWTAWVHKRREK